MLPVECKEDMKIIQYKAAIGDKLVLNNFHIFPGAVKMAGVWLLPKIAEKPLDMRTTQGRQQNENFYHRR